MSRGDANLRSRQDRQLAPNAFNARLALWTSIFAGSGNRSLRLPIATGFLGEHISCQGVGSCPRSAANLAEFTNATFPLQVLAPQITINGRSLESSCEPRSRDSGSGIAAKSRR